MVAVAAGDAQEAARHARDADALLAEPPLTLLLSAQAAQLNGDDRAARRFFAAMLERPETEFLGLRGLLNHAVRDGDREAALHLAERARGLRPQTPWVVESLLDLQARSDRWQAAESTLAEAIRRRLLPAGPARHHRGVVLHQLSLAAAERGEQRQAVALAAQAQALAPDLAPPACHHAEVLIALGRFRAATKALERAWRAAPHPDIARLYAGMQQGAEPLAELRRLQRLTTQNPDARESHLVLAAAALDAQLWGEARRHLERAEGADPPGLTPRLCQMHARLAEAEGGGAAEGARNWLDRALGALPDPCHVCGQCGGESLDWHPLCPHCNAFDTLAWRVPARTMAARHHPPVGADPGAPAPDAARLGGPYTGLPERGLA